MISRRGAWAKLAGAALLVLAGCGPREVKCYRLTATVETPQGERKGHSVIETVFSDSSPFAEKLLRSQAGASLDYRGEAVAVDLPGDQTLFVLLRSANSVDWAGWMHHDAGTGELRTVPRTKPNVSGEAVDNYPYMVRFRDIADPKSVEQVDPDDLAKSFGPGVRLKSLTVQVTDEPVTVGIENRLGWISAMENYDFNKDGAFDAKYPVILIGLRKK